MRCAGVPYWTKVYLRKSDPAYTMNHASEEARPRKEADSRLQVEIVEHPDETRRDDHDGPGRLRRGAVRRRRAAHPLYRAHRRE